MKRILNKDQLLPIEFINSNGNSIKIDKVVKMTGLEYLCGLIVLLFGFNIGYYEAGKGLTNEDLKNLYKKVAGKLKK
ncbi:hypothetical protein IH824_10730 [candidate division KSB1 bacterium]|nr:hypothetical protein [candidate division KSB1 bacterium]MCH8873223.1 hypothetical protein [candidate division KSB1 bacterium]